MRAAVVRIVANPDGESSFVDGDEALVPTDIAPPAGLLGASDPRPATATRFIGAPAGWDSPPHPAPSVRWVIVLRGTVEVRTTDGGMRTFGPGAAVHLEDTVGRGHATRVLPGDDWLALIILE